MNVLVISANRRLLPVPVMPLGACLISEVAERAGNNVTFADLMFERDPLRAVEQAIEDAQPEILGISLRKV